MSAGRLVTGALVAVFLTGTVEGARPEDFNVDFAVGWGGCYRPMEWTPIVVGINSKLTKPFGGTITIAAQQEELSTMIVAHQFVLTPELPLRLPLVTKFAFAAETCSVKIIDTNGKACWKHDYNLSDFSKSARLLTPLGKEDMLIGLVGRGGRELTQLARKAVSRTEEGIGKVYLKPTLPRRLPWDWTGLSSLDLLILYDPDWDLLNAYQSKAIAQWVANGGKLLVVLGSRPLQGDHAIAKLLPFEIGQPTQRPVPPDTLSAWGCSRSQDVTVTCRALRAKPSTRIWDTKTAGYRLAGPAEENRRRPRSVEKIETVSYDLEDPLFATGSAGFGRIGVLGFDPRTLSEHGQDEAVKFWAQHLGAVLHTAPDQSQQRSLAIAEHAPTGADDFHFYEIGVSERSLNSVFEHLLAIRELRPLSIWWVILLLSSLAILLGPVDYFVLKRFDRQPLTWVTAGGWILLFTVAAYYGVQALRSGKAQVRAVSVLDGIEGEPGAWATTYMSLFAPESDEYTLAGLAGRQWWSAISPLQNRTYAFNRGSGTKKILCVQHDGGNLPGSLSINIWSAQCLMSESVHPQLPIWAKVTKLSKNEALAVITNLSDDRIRGGRVRFADNMALRFGPIPPRGTGQFRGRLSTDSAWKSSVPDEYRYPGRRNSFSNDAAYFARGCLQRTRGIQACLQAGAAVVCAEYDSASLPFSVADRKYTQAHIQLVRLVVFPQEEPEK